jgi:hypothetical protein
VDVHRGEEPADDKGADTGRAFGSLSPGSEKPTGRLPDVAIKLLGQRPIVREALRRSLEREVSVGNRRFGVAEATPSGLCLTQGQGRAATNALQRTKSDGVLHHGGS